MPSAFVKRIVWSVFSMVLLLAASVTSGFAASRNIVSAQKTVTASAVVVPSQISELGFVIPGIAKDIPVKEGDIVKAGQTLMALDTPELQFAVDEAQANLRGAQAQLTIRKNEIIKKYKINYTTYTVKKLRLRVPHEVLDIANAGIQQAQASLDAAQASLGEGTLRAPRDGTVVSIDVVPGEFVDSNQTVLTLATLDTLQIETTDLSERDIPSVQIGDPARIFVEALNKNMTGKVIRISPIANTVGGDVLFKVTIAPDTQPQGLLWGMTAEVEIKSGK